MFERFNERARLVLALAQDEARALKHDSVGTEHILLGLLCEEEGVAASVLESLGITAEEVRAQVARVVGRADEVTAGQIPFTPRAKKVLELALSEALALGHGHIGTEHILLALARERDGVAARILLDLGVTSEAAAARVLELRSGRRPAPAELTRFRASSRVSFGPESVRAGGAWVLAAGWLQALVSWAPAS